MGVTQFMFLTDVKLDSSFVRVFNFDMHLDCPTIEDR